MKDARMWRTASVDSRRRGTSWTRLLVVIALGILVSVVPAQAQGGGFVYVPNELDNNVSGYSIDPATGALSPVSGSPFPAGTEPAPIAVNPSSRYVYVGNYASFSCMPQPNDISAYTLDAATGALTAISGSPFMTGNGPVSVAVDPTDRFVYVANRCSGNVFAYAIDPQREHLRQFPVRHSQPERVLCHW
jgi:6-phosphogluconolactonase (cycloisomerase 2 family)